MKRNKLDYLNYYAIIVCNDVMEVVANKYQADKQQKKYENAFIIKAGTDDYTRYMSGANLICVEVGKDEYMIL